MSSLEKQLEVLINLQTETLMSVKELAKLLARADGKPAKTKAE